MTDNPRTAFFDDIASRWDGWEDLPAMASRLAAAFTELGLAPDEAVADVGCGTGNLTRALLEHLSERGRVLAIDLSTRMLDVARRKIDDERVTWRLGGVEDIDLPAAQLDRALCLSVWPHLDDPRAAALRLYEALRPGGVLHVWHLASRERINEIHREAGPAVQADVLPPADETAAHLRAAGFVVTQVVDDDERYLVTGQRPGN